MGWPDSSGVLLARYSEIVCAEGWLESGSVWAWALGWEQFPFADGSLETVLATVSLAPGLRQGQMKQLRCKGAAAVPTGPSSGIGSSAGLESANFTPLIVQIFGVSRRPARL